MFFELFPHLFHFLADAIEILITHGGVHHFASFFGAPFDRFGHLIGGFFAQAELFGHGRGSESGDTGGLDRDLLKPFELIGEEKFFERFFGFFGASRHLFLHLSHELGPLFLGGGAEVEVRAFGPHLLVQLGERFDLVGLELEFLLDFFAVRKADHDTVDVDRGTHGAHHHATGAAKAAGTPWATTAESTAAGATLAAFTPIAALWAFLILVLLGGDTQCAHSAQHGRREGD